MPLIDECINRSIKQDINNLFSQQKVVQDFASFSLHYIDKLRLIHEKKVDLGILNLIEETLYTDNKVSTFSNIAKYYYFLIYNLAINHNFSNDLIDVAILLLSYKINFTSDAEKIDILVNQSKLSVKFAVNFLGEHGDLYKLFLMLERDCSKIVDFYNRHVGKELIVVIFYVHLVLLLLFKQENTLFADLEYAALHSIGLNVFSIYPELVKQFNMKKLQNDLESITFNLIYPNATNQVYKLLQQNNILGSDIFDQAYKNIQDKLNLHNINATIKYRVKKVHSIWFKNFFKSGVMYDIIGVRINVDNVSQCYKVLNIVHEEYFFLENKLKDFIETPKKNGYQSLHTVICLSKSFAIEDCIEVQIRTKKMHDLCSLGAMSHHSYKYEKLVSFLERNKY